MKVRVIVEKWGNYVKNDVIEMMDTTATACIKHKVVESDSEPKKEKLPKK